MSDQGWFGRRGIASLAQSQQKSVGGISAVTRTCIAAYKQFDDIEFLLGVGPKPGQGSAPSMSDEELAQLNKIRERHEKYRVQQDNEVLPSP